MNTDGVILYIYICIPVQNNYKGIRDPAESKGDKDDEKSTRQLHGITPRVGRRLALVISCHVYLHHLKLGRTHMEENLDRMSKWRLYTWRCLQWLRFLSIYWSNLDQSPCGYEWIMAHGHFRSWWYSMTVGSGISSSSKLLKCHYLPINHERRIPNFHYATIIVL